MQGKRDTIAEIAKGDVILASWLNRLREAATPQNLPPGSLATGTGSYQRQPVQRAALTLY